MGCGDSHLQGDRRVELILPLLHMSNGCARRASIKVPRLSAVLPLDFLEQGLG